MWLQPVVRSLDMRDLWIKFTPTFHSYFGLRFLTPKSLKPCPAAPMWRMCTSNGMRINHWGISFVMGIKSWKLHCAKTSQVALGMNPCWSPYFTKWLSGNIVICQPLNSWGTNLRHFFWKINREWTCSFRMCPKKLGRWKNSWDLWRWRLVVGKSLPWLNRNYHHANPYVESYQDQWFLLW